MVQIACDKKPQCRFSGHRGFLFHAGFTHVVAHCSVREAYRSVGAGPFFCRRAHIKRRAAMPRPRCWASDARQTTPGAAPTCDAYCMSPVAAVLRGRRLRGAALRAAFFAGADASSAVAEGAAVSAGAAISGISSMLRGSAFFAFFAAVLRGARSLRRAGCLLPVCGSLASLSTPPDPSAVRVSGDAAGACGSSKMNSLFFGVCACRLSGWV
jgi:hypothetical protein